MPTYDTMVASSEVWQKLPVLEPVAPFLRKAKLRPRKQLELERERAEFWHWRARTEQLRRTGFKPPAGDTFPACIRRAAEAAQERGLVSNILRDDVPVLGKSYGKLTPKQHADAHSVAVERHYALNWLCGHADENDWDATVTDT